MSPKQRLYIEILRRALPVVRNGYSVLYHESVWWRRPFFRGYRSYFRAHYELAQLIHDIPVSLGDPEFTSHDFYILNVHARYFFKHAEAFSHVFAESLRQPFIELFHLVPEEMRDKLEWDGPAAAD